MNQDTRDHIEIMHQHAQRLGCTGRLVVASYGQNPATGIDLTAKVRQFEAGDVAGMLAFIEQISGEKHRNIYCPLITIKPETARTSKGSLADVASVFGLVADFDDDLAMDYADRLPMDADVVLETSAGRFQCFFLFNKALTVGQAQPIAADLKTFCNCDHGTGDVCHVWRVPGLLNWPNKKKVNEGRSTKPQLVKVHEEYAGTMTDVDELRRGLPHVWTPRPKTATRPAAVNMPAVTPQFLRLIDEVCELDREFELVWNMQKKMPKDNSASAFDLSLVTRALGYGFTDEQCACLIYAFRARHVLDLAKLNRKYSAGGDYIARTLEAAKRSRTVHKEADA